MFLIKRRFVYLVSIFFLLFICFGRNEVAEAKQKNNISTIEMDFDGLQYIVDTENMQAKLSGMLSHETAELIVPDFIIYEDQLVPVTEVFEYSFSESNLVWAIIS